MKHEQLQPNNHPSTYALIDEQEGYLNVGGYDIGLDELVSPTVASKIVGLSPRSIRRLVSNGEIPVYRYAPNSMRYLVRDLLEWTEEKRVVIQLERK